MLIASHETRATALAVLSLMVTIHCGCSKEPTTPTEILEHSFKVGDWNTVISVSGQLLEKDPNNTDALAKLGQAHLAVGDYDMAVNDFTRLIVLCPDDAEPYFGRESAYLRLGKKDLATADGQAARERDPHYKSAYAYAPSNFVEPIDLGDAPYLTEDPEEGDDEVDTLAAEDPIESDQPGQLDTSPTNDSLRSGTASDSSGPIGDSVVAVPTEPAEPAEPMTNAGLSKESTVPRPGVLDPKAPKLVHENHIPKMHLNGDPKPGGDAPDGDKGLTDKGLTDLGQLRFPVDPKELGEPTGEPDGRPEAGRRENGRPAPNSGLTNSLPLDELGNVLVPNRPPGKLSTGLPTNGLGDLSPSTLTNIGPSAIDGSSTPSLSTGGFATINPIVPDPTRNPGFGSALGTPLPGQPTTGINGPLPPQDMGYSGLPIPTNGSTGLPASNTPVSNFTPRVPIGFGPANSQFRGNPIYTNKQQPVISTSLPGFQSPNLPSPQLPGTGGGPTISTSLSDTVLQDRLRGSVPPTSSTRKLRSIQP